MPSTGSLLDKIASGQQLEDSVRASYAVVNAVQDYPPASQVMGITLTFAAFAEALGVSPQFLLERAARAEKDVNAPWHAQVRAAKAYAKGELA